MPESTGLKMNWNSKINCQYFVAPMGSGKTEAIKSLIHSAAKSGVYKWFLVMSPTRLSGEWDCLPDEAVVSVFAREGDLDLSPNSQVQREMPQRGEEAEITARRDHTRRLYRIRAEIVALRGEEGSRSRGQLSELLHPNATQCHRYLDIESDLLRSTAVCAKSSKFLLDLANHQSLCHEALSTLSWGSVRLAQTFRRGSHTKRRRTTTTRCLVVKTSGQDVSRRRTLHLSQSSHRPSS